MSTAFGVRLPHILPPSRVKCQLERKTSTGPTPFIAETAKAHKVLSRAFSPKSHVAAIFYSQVSKTEALNSICDVARANDALWHCAEVRQGTTQGLLLPHQGPMFAVDSSSIKLTVNSFDWVRH